MAVAAESGSIVVVAGVAAAGCIAKRLRMAKEAVRCTGECAAAGCSFADTVG